MEVGRYAKRLVVVEGYFNRNGNRAVATPRGLGMKSGFGDEPYYAW